MAAEEGQVIRCNTYEEWIVQLNKAKGSNKLIFKKEEGKWSVKPKETEGSNKLIFKKEEGKWSVKPKETEGSNKLIFKKEEGKWSVKPKETEGSNKLIFKKEEGKWTVKPKETEGSNKLIVIYFTSSDCPLCGDISPLIARLAEMLKSTTIFFEVDGVKLQRAAKDFKVQQYPTFVAIEGGKVVDMLQSSDKGKIKEKITDWNARGLLA